MADTASSTAALAAAFRKDAGCEVITTGVAARLCGVGYDIIRSAIAHGHLRAAAPRGMKHLRLTCADLAEWVAGVNP